MEKIGKLVKVKVDNRFVVGEIIEETTSHFIVAITNKNLLVNKKKVKFVD